MSSSRVFAPFAVLAVLAACSAGGEDENSADESSEGELRSLAANEIVGDLAFGETQTVRYTETPRYRAFRIHATAGANVDAWVRSVSGDAHAWLLGANYRTLASNDDANASTKDARVQKKVPSAGTYYLVIRDENGEDADFDVSLAGTLVPDAGPTRVDAGPTRIDAGPNTNDPFDPSSCSGATMSAAQAAAKFAPGASSVTLGTFQMSARQRDCTQVTGCGPWRDFKYTSPGWPNIAVPMAGSVELNVAGSAVTLRLVSSLCGASHGTGSKYGPTCGTVAGAPLSCGVYDYDSSEQWGGSGGTFCSAGAAYLGDDTLKLSGSATEHCARFTAKGNSTDGSRQYEAVITSRY